MKWSENLGLISIILMSWGIALFKYCFQVPANRIGYKNKRWSIFFSRTESNPRDICAWPICNILNDLL